MGIPRLRVTYLVFLMLTVDINHCSSSQMTSQLVSPVLQGDVRVVLKIPE